MKTSFSLNSKKKKELIIWLCLSFILITILFIFLFHIKLNKKTELQALRLSRSILQDKVTFLEKDLVAKKLNAKKKDHLKNVFSKLNRYSSCENKSFMSNLLVDLAANIPPSIYLSQLDCSQPSNKTSADKLVELAKKVELQGFAIDVQSVLNLLQILSKLPYINHGKIVHLRTSNYSDSLLEFFIKLDIKPNKENV